MPPSASGSGMARTRWLVFQSQDSGSTRSGRNGSCRGVLAQVQDAPGRPAAQPGRDDEEMDAALPVAPGHRIAETAQTKPQLRPGVMAVHHKVAGLHCRVARSNWEVAICTSGPLSREPANQ